MLDNLKTVLIDCDGVLWRGKEAIEGASEFLKWLKHTQRKMFFVTNSSVSTRAQHAEKVKCKLGLDFDIGEDSVLTAAAVTTDYLSTHLPTGSSLYVMGMEGIQMELQAKGFKVIVAPSPGTEGISAVVVGFDPTFSYDHVAQAMKIFALNPDCMFIGCNLDSSYVNESGFLAPGTGTLVTAVAYATGRKPTIMGKPNNLLHDTLLLRCPDFKPEEAVFIGDRLDSDIAFANANGIASILVETGVNKRNDVKDIIPSFIVENLSKIFK